MNEDLRVEVERGRLEAITGLTVDYIRDQVLPKLSQLSSIYGSRGRVPVLPAEVKLSKIHKNGLFATRDMKKNEVFITSSSDVSSVACINDAVIFQESTATNLADMKEDYCFKMEEYRKKAIQLDNVEYIYENYSGEDVPCSLVVLKDIQKGDEMLRSYGIPAWITNQKTRFNTRLDYQWLAEEFHVIFANEKPRVRDEVLFIVVEQVLSKVEFADHARANLRRLDGLNSKF
jgi:hypothetical protein